MFKVPICSDNVIVSVHKHKTFDDFLVGETPIHDWVAGGALLLSLHKDLDEMMEGIAVQFQNQYKGCIFVMIRMIRMSNKHKYEIVLFRDGKRYHDDRVRLVRFKKPQKH